MGCLGYCPTCLSLSPHIHNWSAFRSLGTCAYFKFYHYNLSWLQHLISPVHLATFDLSSQSCNKLFNLAAGTSLLCILICTQINMLCPVQLEWTSISTVSNIYYIQLLSVTRILMITRQTWFYMFIILWYIYEYNSYTLHFWAEW